jgi:hypothetical protein
MFKRVRWMTTGAAVGFGASVWVQRKLKSAADQYRPAAVVEAATQRAKEALDEGRTAMRQREAELRTSGRSRPSRRRSNP